MSNKPNDTTTDVFNTRNVFGQLAAPDSTPTAVLYRNGVIDATVTVTVAQLTTTRFSATYTIPGTYSAGDTLQVIVSWTMGGAADELPLPIYVIDSARLYDITAGTMNARATVEGYAAGEDPGTLLLNITVPSSGNTAHTVAAILDVLRTMAVGGRNFEGNNLNYLGDDNATVKIAFAITSTINSVTPLLNPTGRTPNAIY